MAPSYSSELSAHELNRVVPYFCATPGRPSIGCLQPCIKSHNCDMPSNDMRSHSLARSQVWRPMARVSVLDSGYMLGDGVWEGLRLHKGVLVFAQVSAFVQVYEF
jgi:hypothetical protein